MGRKSKGKRVTSTFRTSPETHSSLVRVAEALGVDMNWVVTLLITAGLPTLHRIIAEMKVGVEEAVRELTGDSGGPS